MEKAAIGTNDLGMHIVIRPISKDLLSEAETVGMETGKINSLLTARRPITLVDAISALPPLLPVPMHRWRTRVSLAAMLSVLIKRSGAFHLHLIPFFHRGKEAAGC